MNLTEVLGKYFSEDETAKIAGAIRSGLPIIINGAQEPTGKTTLCEKLRELGYNVSERWELQKKREQQQCCEHCYYSQQGFETITLI